MYMHTATFTDCSKPHSDTLLVVIDMQHDFVHGTLGSVEAQAIVDAVVQKIQSHKGPIVYTLDTHHSDYLQTQEGKHLPIEHCIKGKKGHELIDELKVLLALSPCFEKPTFGSLELAQAIANDESLSKVELIGLCTDICVVSNALLIKALSPELHICVDAKCCAGTTQENHLAALKTMNSCQIEVF